MKKLLALFLTVVLLTALFPARFTAQAESVTKKGFYMVNWDDFEEVGSYKFDYVYHMPYTWLNTTKADHDPLPVSLVCYNTSNVKTAAQRMYEDFSKRPEGTRIFNYSALATILKENVVDVVDMEKGVAISRKWLDSLLSEYKSLGGKLDGIAIDLEYNKCYAHYIESEQYAKGNKDIYNQIVNNPVYKEKIRPELEKQGFIFYTNPDPAKYPERSEIWTIYRYDKEGGISSCRSIWSQTMQRLLVDYINRSALEIMLKYYPDAFMSDYKTGELDTWYKPMDSDGSSAFGYNYLHAGNTSNYNAYQWQPSASLFGYASTSNRTQRNKYAKPAGYHDAVYPDTPYGQFLFETNLQKRMLVSTDNGRVNTWLTFFNYGSSKPYSYSNTPYYAEQIYHSGLSTSETFFGYIIAKEVRNKGANFDDENIGDYGYNLKVIDDALAELTRVAGASDRKPIVLPMEWNGYTLSGMYAGGRNIWRITPDVGKVSLEDFKVKDTAPTFCVDGVTITFPQGRIISDGNVRQVGSCGYWVETPANVNPVITGGAERYSKNPSFQETFEGYKTGVFGDNSVRPNTYWSVSSDSVIVEKDGNKSLSLFGNCTLKNSKVTEKITAGDYFAQKQGWEVTVTLPEGDYGQVRLLGYGDTDKGFKVFRGKVFYDQSGTHTEMEGVTLAAGTYIFKRELDFNTFKCNYYVYDTAGKLLGSVKDVSIKTQPLPVQNITIQTYNTVDHVQVDDYKLYPMGVQTSLDLYGAEYGRKVSATNVNKAQTVDTAYRLSWLNATDKYQIARIYDVKTGTILKKVEMAPGINSVTTDIVKIGEGQEITFAVHVQEGPDRTHQNYDAGNFAWTAAAETIGLATGTKGATGADYVPLTDDGVGKEGDSINPFLEADKKAEATDPTEGQDTVGGDDTADGTTPKKGLPGGIIAVIVIAGLAVVGGAAYLFIIKPKLAQKPEETIEE